MVDYTGISVLLSYVVVVVVVYVWLIVTRCK